MQNKVLTKGQQKRVTDFTGAEGKALQKSDVCDANHAKQKLLNKAKRRANSNVNEISLSNLVID